MNIPRILLTQIVALAFQELDGMNDHTSAEATARAISAAEEENGEAIRRIMSQAPDVPVAAFPLVSMAYAMAALSTMGKCQGVCWVACRTYANRLMAMMHLPAPDSDGYKLAIVDFLERHQDQLQEVAKEVDRGLGPAKEEALAARDLEPHPAPTNRGPTVQVEGLFRPFETPPDSDDGG